MSLSLLNKKPVKMDTDPVLDLGHHGEIAEVATPTTFLVKKGITGGTRVLLAAWSRPLALQSVKVNTDRAPLSVAIAEASVVEDALVDAEAIKISGRGANSNANLDPTRAA